MNLFNLVVEPQYRSVVQSCVNDLLASSDKEQHVVSRDGMVDSPMGDPRYVIYREHEHLYIVDANKANPPSYYEKMRGDISETGVTFNTVYRTTNTYYHPASIHVDDDGDYLFGCQDGGSFSMPFTMVEMDGEKKYFRNGWEVSHASVTKKLGELPDRITAQHQFAYGTSVWSWFNDDTLSWLADLVGFDKEEMGEWLLLAWHDRAAAEELTRRTQGKLTVGYYLSGFVNCDIIVKDERTNYVVTPEGSGVVICDADRYIILPRNSDRPGLVLNWNKAEPPSNDKMALCVAIAHGAPIANGRTANKIPRKDTTGVIDIQASGYPKQMFVKDGYIQTSDTVRSILGEVPEIYTDEDAAFLTLCL